MTKQTSTWYHEDGHRQIDLAPKTEAQLALWQTRVSDESRSRDGIIDWMDIFVHAQPAGKFADLNVHVDDLALRVPSSLQRIDRVLTGTFSDQRLAPLTVSWGGLIFAEFDTAQIVQNVWFCDIPPSHADIFGVFADACTKTWNLLVIDQPWCQIIDLRDPKALEKYLQARHKPRR